MPSRDGRLIEWRATLKGEQLGSMLIGLVSTLPTLLLYEAIPILVILIGIALLVWVLTSLGQRRSRTRRRVAMLTGGAMGGVMLVLIGFVIALNS